MVIELEDLNPQIIQSIKDVQSSDVCDILESFDLINENTLDRNGRNLLFYAVEFKNLHATQFLISKSVFDINHQNNNGNTVLHIAVSFGDLEMVELLLKRGANPNLKNKEGDSVIFNVLFLSNKDNSLEIIKVLKQHKANIDEENNKGLSPILIAISNIDKKIANYLVKLGVKIDFLDKNSIEKVLSHVISSTQAKGESRQKMLEMISEIKDQQKQNKILSPDPIEIPSTVISRAEFYSIAKESFLEL